jgi:hypothetical protein
MAETTKYYKMEECFDACGDDDSPFCILDNGDEWNASSLSKKIILEKDCTPTSWLYINSDKWQIKRAEPKVLTADEYIYSINSKEIVKDGRYLFTWDKMRECFNYSRKNGRLEEWQRPEQVELRDAAIDVFMLYHYFKDHLGPDVCGILNKLNKALNNLKPPYGQDSE